MITTYGIATFAFDERKYFIESPATNKPQTAMTVHLFRSLGSHVGVGLRVLSGAAFVGAETRLACSTSSLANIFVASGVSTVVWFCCSARANSSALLLLARLSFISASFGYL